MTIGPFDRETWLDLTVNIIPLVIIGFFLAMYIVVPWWGWDPLNSAVMIFLHVMPFVSLIAITYLSGKLISRDEKQADRGEEVHAEAEAEA